DQTPSEACIASMLSLPSFCMSSRFLTIELSAFPGRLAACANVGAAFRVPTGYRAGKLPYIALHNKSQVEVRKCNRRVANSDHLTLWQRPSPSFVDCALAVTVAVDRLGCCR